MAPRLYLEGKTFHFLKVIEPMPLPKRYRSGNNVMVWKCICICGKVCEAVGSHLISGTKKSCGCKNFISGTHGNRGISAADASFKAVENSYFQKARYNNQKWELNFEQVVELITASCFYCGRPPSRPYNVYMTKSGKMQRTGDPVWMAQGAIIVNGIDRVDNNLGYISSNVVTACTQCNFAKHTQTVASFQEWLTALVKFQYKKMNGV